MEEEVPNATGSSIPVSESVSSTLLEEAPDHPVLEDTALFDKTQQEPMVSSLFQSTTVHYEDDVKGVCASLVQSETNDPEQIKTIAAVSSEQVSVYVGNSETCSEMDLSSVQSEELCPENKVHKISSDAIDQDEQKYSSAQKVKPEQNISMCTISSDEVPVESVAPSSGDRVRDGALFVDLTCESPDALSNTSNRSDQDVEINPDTSPLVTSNSFDDVDDSEDVSKVTHITKNTGKFDNIFEAMTSNIELDTENSGCIVENKSSEIANATSLPHALQSDLDSNITSNKDADKWVDETISSNASAVQKSKVDKPSTFKDIVLGSNQELDKNETSNFQSDESILNEISKICDQVNMADDSEGSSPSVESVSDVEDSNLNKSQDVDNVQDPVITASAPQELHDTESNNPEMPTNCPKIDMQYSLSSEAERQEEIMAMQRDLYEDDIEGTTNSNQHSPTDCSPTLLSPSNPGHEDKSEQPATAMTSSPVLKIKEEPMDYEDYLTADDQVKSNKDLSQKSPESSTTADDPVDSNVLLMSEVMSLNSSQTLLDLASKHLESMSAAVGEESVVIENVSSTPSPVNIIDSQTQNLIKSLENFDLEWIKGVDSVRYKSPRIPLKLRDSFSMGPFSCLGCGDSFLFESSLDTHLNRKCLQIVCKNDKCLNTNPIPEFFNRCSYLIHCKHHDKKSLDHNLEASCATDDMLQNIADLVEPSVSQAYCAEFKSSLEFSWTCVECNIKFDSAKALASHFVPNHDGFAESQCDICKKHLFTECSLSAHRRIHSKEKPYVCPECGQMFLGNWEAFSKHLNMKCFHTHRQPSLTCQKCNITGTSFEKMTQHLLCHKEVYMKCQKCPMAFKAMKTFQTHMKTTHAIMDENFPHGEVFKCSMCDTVFHNLDHLTIHTRKHVEQFNKKTKYHFKCWLCPCTQNNRVGIERHLMKQHRIKPCKVLCDLCGSHFENFTELLTHLELNGCSQFYIPTNIKNAEGTQTYQEDELVVQQALEQHLEPQKIKLKIKKKKGSAVSPDTNNYFKCSICDYKCNKANVSDINAHIRKHRSDGIFLCSICLTAVYDTFTDLHRHQFLCRKKKAGKKGSPSKDNPTAALTCQKCSARLPTDVKLTEHMLTEHGVAPQFPCHLCGLTYDTQHSLHQHIQLVHEGKKHLYLCWICQSKNTKRTFTAASKLERHLVVKHRVPRNIIDPDKFPRLLPGLNQKDTIIDLAPEQEKDGSSKQVPIKRLKLADDTVYSCAKCEFSSENRDEFEVHIKTHKTESTSRQCPECGLCFSVLPSLKKHLIMVHKIKDISTYVRTSGLDDIQHIEPSTITKSPNPASLSDVDNPLDCRVCYKSFDSEISLKTHMRTHGMAYIRSKRAPTTFPSPSLVTEELK